MPLLPQTPLTIIGGGLSGLTLARTLLHHNIPTQIYERTPSPPAHNYALTLHHSSYAPLLPILGIDFETFHRRVAVDYRGSTISNPRNFPRKRNVTEASFRAHRGRLEGLLREGLAIKWEHGLENVEAPGENQDVLLTFQNGVEVKSPFVVAADGVHSTVRKSLLPPHEAEPKVLAFVVFNGKKKVERKVFDEIYEPVLKEEGVCEVKLEGGIVLGISVIGVREDEVGVSWTYSRRSNGEDEKLWRPERSTEDAKVIPKSFYEEVRALEALDLEQPFKEVFGEEKVGADRVLHWLMRRVLVSLGRLRWLGSKNVFLLGDALHAEPILGGEGANVALVDGFQMGEWIAGKGKEGLDVWYESRYGEWGEGVEESVRVIAGMHGGEGEEGL